MAPSSVPRAFTLVELLVVVAVVGVLMGLLFPVCLGARAAARATQCRHQLGQLGHALALYAEDYRGDLPRRGQGVQPLARIDRSSDWFNALPPYLDTPPYVQLVEEGRPPKEGDEVVFICPEARDPGGRHFLPLAMNMYLSPWIRPDPHNLDEIPRPSQLVFMADAPGPYASTVPSRNAYSVVARHRGNANLVFVDQHVGAFKGSYLGCGSGDPHRPDVQWETGTSGVNQSPVD